MKKLLAGIVLVAMLVFCCVGMVACNGGFQLVKSISITTNGETKTFSSSTEASYSLTGYSIISEEEFNEAPQNRNLYSEGASGLKKFGKFTVKDAIKASKNATRYEVVEKELEGDWYVVSWRTELNRYFYYICSYECTYFNFVYAKVKNDTTVVIKNGGKTTQETTYTVTSYKIIKF